MSQTYVNHSIARAKNKHKAVRKRMAHIETTVTVRGKSKRVCSCGGQSKLGSAAIKHIQLL